MDEVQPRELPPPISDEQLEHWKVQYQYRAGIVLDHILLDQFGAILARLEAAEKARDAAKAVLVEERPDLASATPVTAAHVVGRGLSAGPLTEDTLREWRRLAEGATKGPWTTDGGDVRFVYVGTEPLSKVYRNGDAAFIAASRVAVPALLDECERLRRGLEAINAPSSTRMWDG